MSVTVDIVTPRTAKTFLTRIEARDGRLDHLCMELVHWGFEECIAWVYQVNAVCRRDRAAPRPTISVHSFDDYVTANQLNAFRSAGAVWMPRRDEGQYGKDPVTMIEERLYYQKIKEEREAANAQTASLWDHLAIDSDLQSYQDLSSLIRPETFEMPDKEFEEMLNKISETMKED